MPKAKKIQTEMTVAIAIPGYREVNGNVVEHTDTYISIAHKKPRSSKSVVETFPLNQLYALYLDGDGIGTALVKGGPFQYDEVDGTLVKVEGGFIHLETSEGTVMIAESTASMISEVSAPAKGKAPVKKGRKPSKAEIDDEEDDDEEDDEDDDDEDEAPAKKGKGKAAPAKKGKGKKDDEEDDEEEEDDDEEEDEAPAKKGKGKAAPAKKGKGKKDDDEDDDEDDDWE